MKKVLIGLVVVLALALPGLLPSNVELTKPADTMSAVAMTAAPTTYHIPILDAEVQVWPGGEAKAQVWILVWDLCQMRIPGMCDIFWEGLDNGWW